MGGAIALLIYIGCNGLFLFSAMKDNVVYWHDNYSARTKILLVPVLVGWAPTLHFMGV